MRLLPHLLLVLVGVGFISVLILEYLADSRALQGHVVQRSISNSYLKKVEQHHAG